MRYKIVEKVSYSLNEEFFCKYILKKNNLIFSKNDV